MGKTAVMAREEIRPENANEEMEWSSEEFDLEPLPEVDGEGLVTNDARRYGSSRGRTADLIREAIYESGMSQGDVARKIRMTSSNLSLILAGDFMPSLRVVAELSALLGKPIETIVDLEEVRRRGEEARATRSQSRVKVERAKRVRSKKK